MADRYWVGGSGTWNTTSTTNWSAASGGAGGASVPTIADNVFFDQAATYTVTMTGALACLNITVSAGTVTFATGTSPTLNVRGSMSLAAGTLWNSTGTITFSATTTGQTITTNGVSVNAPITFNGTGGVWTLGSALTTNNGITITAGTLNTSASNYAVNAFNIAVANSVSAILTLNGSTVTLSGAGSAFSVSASGVINAGTSTINYTSASSSTFSGGGKTYYNVRFTGAATSNVNFTITGANSFNNLEFTAPSSATVASAVFGSNQTINGALTMSGGSVTQRLFYRSDAVGTARTLTLANPATLTNCDFRDITAATNAITATTGGGDCGGNTNITFPAAKTVYWNLAGAQNWSANGWAATSGGTPAVSNFPLAQDTAVFDNAGSVTGAITINAPWNIGTIDMSSRTSAMTLAVNSCNVYGSWLTGTGVTQIGTQTVTFLGRGNTQNISTNGVTFTNGITIQNIGGTVKLLGALTTASSVAVTLTNGTLDLNNFTLTTGVFISSNSNTRTIAFGTGNITVNGTGTVFNITAIIGFTSTGTQVVNVANNTATAASATVGAMSEANAISFNFTAGTYSLNFPANAGAAFRDANFTGFSGTWNTTQNVANTCYGSLTLSTGMTLAASTGSLIFGSTSGTETITSNGKKLDFPVSFNGVGGTWVLQDAMTLDVFRNATLTNGTLNLNGKTLTAGVFATAAGTKNITFNGGTIACIVGTVGGGVSAFNNAAPTGFTTTAGTGSGTITLTGPATKTFVGGGSTFDCVLNLGGTGALTVTGSNTFRDITNTVQPTSVLFTAGTTTTFTSGFSLSGTAGNLVTISSATAAQHTLSKASGIVDVSYCNISYSNATGGATWNAFT